LAGFLTTTVPLSAPEIFSLPPLATKRAFVFAFQVQHLGGQTSEPRSQRKVAKDSLRILELVGQAVSACRLWRRSRFGVLFLGPSRSRLLHEPT